MTEVGIILNVDDSQLVKALQKEIALLKELNKEVGKTEKELDGAFEEGANDVKKLNTELTKTGKAAKGINLKNTFSSDTVKQLKSTVLAIGGFAASAGLIGKAFKGAATTIKDFDQATANLSSIAGKSRDEIGGLVDQAIELGAKSAFSASQVLALQTELAKLGFNESQILASAEAIGNFSIAVGTDAARAAALGGSAIRAFGLDVEDIEDVVSSLAVATTKSALDFSFLETALSTVAPVAESLGFSLEDTTGLLGVLANSGFDASTAATSLRNIFLKLADENGDLAKSLGGPIKSIDQLAPALNKLKDEGVNLNEVLELTDVRSAAAFSKFLSNADDAKELSESITGVNDELQIMVDKRLDTVEGSLTLLSSSWEGFILSVEKGDGVLSGSFKGLVDNLTGAISRLTQLNQGTISFLDLLRSTSAFGSLNVDVEILNKELNDVNRQIEKRNELLAQDDLSAADRLKTRKEAFALEQEALEKQIELSAKRVGILNARGAEDGVTTEIKDGLTVQFEAIEVARERLEVLKEEQLLLKDISGESSFLADEPSKTNRASVGDQEEANKEAKKLQDKAIEDAIKSAERLEKELAKIQDKSLAAFTDGLGEEERIEQIRANTLAEIEAIRQGAEDLAKEAGVSIDIADEINELKLQAQREYIDALNELEEERAKEARSAEERELEAVAEYLETKLPSQITTSIDGVDTKIEFDIVFDANGQGELFSTDEDLLKQREDDIAGVFGRIQKNTNEQLEKIGDDADLSPLESIKKKITDALGIDDKQLGQIVDSFSSTVSSLISTYKDNIDTQLKIETDVIDELIDARQKVIDSLENQLKTEQDLQEKGRANNVDGIQEQLKKEVAAQEAAEAEKLALKKDALKKQLVIDSAAQISAAAVGAIQLFSGFQSISLGLGLLAGAAAVASFFAVIKSIKSQSQAINALHTGGHLGDYLPGARTFGQVNPRGRSDKPGRGRGHRIEDSNLVVGGYEYVHKEEVSRKQLPFFDKLNKGAYGNVDMIEVMNFYEQFKDNVGQQTDVIEQLPIGPSIATPIVQRVEINQVGGGSDLNVAEMSKIIENQTKRLEKLEREKKTAQPIMEDGQLSGVLVTSGNTVRIERVG